VLLALTYGCTTLQLPLYTSPPIDRYENVQVKGGLAVAVHPLVDEQEIKKYFGMNLLAAGILPVFVIGENRHASSSFLLLKEGISLTAAGVPDRPADGIDKPQSEANAKSVGYAALALGVNYVLVVIAAKRISDASVINLNFKAQEFHTRTLSPGQTAKGFVYFRLPEDGKLPKQSAVWLEALEAMSREAKRFKFSCP